ncbi:hypothetical protein C7B89_21965 [Lysinibacillus capsici]|nr:hypothetical protein C7B89_21965 [Lysinibacillus capsici]
MKRFSSTITGFENVDFEKLREEMKTSSKKISCHYCSYTSENRNEFKIKSIVVLEEIDDRYIADNNFVLLCYQCLKKDY